MKLFALSGLLAGASATVHHFEAHTAPREAGYLPGISSLLADCKSICPRSQCTADGIIEKNLTDFMDV